ncbi:hypothetical protein [Lentzea cavernae]|uniref:SPOR domain-containing protein n=1 Tax=Lentzea cavernae TaxID=2020703 RepID=A0ABQ3MU48_9PSEU|nr:hypothetical protein [Lentzea cavernae]GHH57770.1 hypothetical protein GCM10017774_78000 [Lentzea cavernae]
MSNDMYLQISGSQELVIFVPATAPAVPVVYGPFKDWESVAEAKEALLQARVDLTSAVFVPLNKVVTEP